MSDKLLPGKRDPLFALAEQYATDFDDVTTLTDSKRRLVTISGNREGKHYSMTIQQTDHGETRSVSAYDTSRPKSEYVNEALQMRAQGMKQIDIAQRLGMSQAMVSKLIGKKRGK